MKLLLDTHCLIWALTDAPELDAKARRVIADAESVWFSEASIWELGLKWRKGKIGCFTRRLGRTNAYCYRLIGRLRRLVRGWYRRSKPVWAQ